MIDRILAGLKVIDLTQNVAGPYCTQILGDMGAEVIKVERPGSGDDTRAWRPPAVAGQSPTFLALNRNKASVCVDVASDAGAQVIKDLAASADILVHSMKPGSAERRGLGYEQLHEINPRLIYCAISAFGNVGPLSALPGYDPLMQAFGGIMSTTGEEGRPPVRVGPSIVDLGTGMWAVIGMLTALKRRADSGRGGVIDVSLFETTAGWMSLLAANYQASGELPTRLGSGAIGIAPYRAYATKDSDLVVAAGSDALFRKLAQVLGHPQWADDPRFASNPKRVANQNALYALIEAEMLKRSNAEWIAALEGAGIPCAPVQNVAEMIAHEQTRALGLIQDVPGSTMKFIGLPLSIDGQRPAIRSRPPTLGEHTQQILNTKE